MHFEGPEKKIEIIVSRKMNSLRKLHIWPQIVNCANAKILSSISNNYCDAYILSESSLFVYDDSFTMITCGKTSLVKAIIEFSKNISPDLIESLIFERKNEISPNAQATSFLDDVNLLHKVFHGKAFRFGDENDHHILIYHLGKAFKPEKDDVTLEILMHGISKNISSLFTHDQNKSNITKILKLNELFPDFAIDEYFFNPAGYSLNGIKNNKYFTLHVTPQEVGSYISLETTFFSPRTVKKLISSILSIFKPKSCDIVLFQNSYLNNIKCKNYFLRCNSKNKLSCGYHIQYLNYSKNHSESLKPYQFSLETSNLEN